MPPPAEKLADVMPPTAFVCVHVEGGEPVLAAYRDDPIVSNDAGWQFFCGRSDDCGEPEMMILDDVLERDPSLRELLDRPVGTGWARESATEAWTEVREPS